MPGSMSWAAPSPAHKYGGALVRERQNTTDDADSLNQVAGPADHLAGLDLSPKGPLFWFGVLAAVTVGLMSYSTAVRVGPATATVKLGD